MGLERLHLLPRTQAGSPTCGSATPTWVSESKFPSEWYPVKLNLKNGKFLGGFCEASDVWSFALISKSWWQFPSPKKKRQKSGGCYSLLNLGLRWKMSKGCAYNGTFWVKAEPIRACSACPLGQKGGVSSSEAGYVWGKVSDRIAFDSPKKNTWDGWGKGLHSQQHLQVHNCSLQLHLEIMIFSCLIGRFMGYTLLGKLETEKPWLGHGKMQ